MFVFLIPRFSPLPHQFSCLATGPKTLEHILHMVFFSVCPPLMDNLFTLKIKGNFKTLQTSTNIMALFHRQGQSWVVSNEIHYITHFK